MIMCEHVYKNMKEKICPLCGKDTHAYDWDYQNKINAEWKLANPDAKSDGWWSI